MNKFLILIIILIFNVTANAQSLSTPTACLGFAHRGQSNDSGQGALPGGVPVPASNARQFNYTKGGQWWSMFEPSQSVDSTYGGAAYPIFVDSPILYGPALPFSEAMSTAFPQYNICNFPGAVGGISLAGQLPTNSTANAYGAARAMIIAGKATGVNVTMIGAIFVGMETDATNSTNAANIVANFTTWVRGFRADNGSNAIVVFAQLGTTPVDTGTYAFWNTVKTNQALINIPDVYMVTTDDLAKDPTFNLHYTTASLNTLGARMAAVMVTAMRGHVGGIK